MWRHPDMTWKALSTTAVILAAALVAAPAQAATGQVVTKVSEPDRAAALGHWTPERIKAEALKGLGSAVPLGDSVKCLAERRSHRDRESSFRAKSHLAIAAAGAAGCGTTAAGG